MNSSLGRNRISNTPEGAFGLIRRHLTASVIAVFGDYQVEARSSESIEASNENEDVVMAIIGFAGEHMRGSLVITAAASSVEAWRGPFGKGWIIKPFKPELLVVAAKKLAGLV